MKSAPGHDPRNQVAAGSFLAFWCLAGWWALTVTPALSSEDYGVDPGPGLLPRLVLTILTLGALLLIGNGVRRMLSAPAEPGYWDRLRRGTLVPAIFVLTLAIYVPAIGLLGYVPASVILALAWMTFLGLRSREGGPMSPLLQAGAGTAIGVGLIYLIFVHLIGVPVG
jgi:hypothetical protein